MGCGRQFPLEHIREILTAEEIPNCDRCHGILKPDVVFFGESLPRETLEAAIQRSRHSDLFVVIGSTLVVYPAAYMPVYAKQGGAKLAIINLAPTPYDHQADVVVQEKAGVAMEMILEGVKKRV